MPDDVTNSELARRIDSLQASMPGYVLEKVAAAEKQLWESRLSEMTKDISALDTQLDKLKADLKAANEKRADDRRQYIKLFVGALLAAIVPTIALVLSLTQTAPL